MRVNFHFTNILTTRLVRSGIAIILFAVFFTTSSYRDPSDRSLLVKEVKVFILIQINRRRNGTGKSRIQSTMHADRVSSCST